MSELAIEREIVTKADTDDAIKELSTKLTEAENEIDILREERYNLQEEYNKLVNKQYHLDYKVTEQEELLKEIRKTLELYEKENNALKVLLSMYL